MQTSRAADDMFGDADFNGNRLIFQLYHIVSVYFISKLSKHHELIIIC